MKKYIVLLPFIVFLASSCKKYINVGTPATAITPASVFSDSTSTLGAVLALYLDFPGESVSLYPSMSADDISVYPISSLGIIYSSFATNTLTALPLAGASLSDESPYIVAGLYQGFYSQIYQSNLDMEGIASSNAYGQTYKNQLTGECLFWRALAYYYLVNFFGDVPLALTSNITTNETLSRTPAAQVYQQIITDLTTAEADVSPDYPSSDRTRINQNAVAALLSRVYLYQGQNWVAAEQQATQVINSGAYQLETNLNNVFINTSPEIILQAWTEVNGSSPGVTGLATDLIPVYSPNGVMNDSLMNSFEPGDLRKQDWVGAYPYGGVTYYYPYKEKDNNTSQPGNEYYIVLRLAEQYLIRAEARARQNNISGPNSAESDINIVRQRAGLPNIQLTDLPSAMAALEHERWVELFAENSDRWFNLKRTGRIDTVLPLTKPGITWKPYQALYPFTDADIKADPKLAQNPGY